MGLKTVDFISKPATRSSSRVPLTLTNTRDMEHPVWIISSNCRKQNNNEACVFTIIAIIDLRGNADLYLAYVSLNHLPFLKTVQGTDITVREFLLLIIAHAQWRGVRRGPH